MARLAGIALALTLLLPFAAATPGEFAAPRVDVDAFRDAASRAGSAVAGAAGAGASAAAAAVASAVGAAVAFLASGAARLGSATLALLVAGAAAVGSALASLAALASSLVADGAAVVRAHPRASAVAAGSAGALGTLAWLAKRFGWLSAIPLYTRLAPSQMLDNAARHRVYDHVRANPGAHPSAIAEALDLGWGTVVYHLQRLEESKLVTSRAASHRKCFFATGTEMGADARAAVAAMSHDKAKLIVSAVRESPGITQKDVAERVGMSQALASWHVKRLVASGVLLSARIGRSNTLHVAEHVPDLASAPPVAIAA